MLAVMKKLTYDEEYNFENEVLCGRQMQLKLHVVKLSRVLKNIFFIW